MKPLTALFQAMARDITLFDGAGWFVPVGVFLAACCVVALFMFRDFFGL